MDSGLTITISLHTEDEPLLERTWSEYMRAVERGEMSDADAWENYLSLFCGMTTILADGKPVGRVTEWFKDGR